MTLRYGYVVATYPSGNSIDVLLDRDGARLSNVQISSYTGSSNTGIVDLPDIGAPADDTRWDITGPVTRYMIAMIDFLGSVPVCMGFILPQVNQVSFNKKNFRVDRHASDVYETIDANGNIERYHPSGTFFRIATSPAHVDLTGQDVDQKWAIKNNVAASVYAILEVANQANGVVATFQIDPSGNVLLTHAGNLTTTTAGNATLNVTGTTNINSTGNLTATVQGTTNINSTGNAEVTAPTTTVNGNAVVTGNAQVQGTATIANLVVT